MVWVLTAQFPTTCQAPLACPCCRGGPQGWLTQHVSNCRRTSISPMTTTSLTSGLPQRRSPEGITPSSPTSGPSGFSSMRFSAGVRCPIQVLGPSIADCQQGSGGLPPGHTPLHHSLGIFQGHQPEEGGRSTRGCRGYWSPASRASLYHPP